MSEVLADFWVGTMYSNWVLIPEPILDLAQVTPQGGGLIARFARHTQQLGPALANLLSQHSTSSRAYTDIDTQVLFVAVLWWLTC